MNTDQLDCAPNSTPLLLSLLRSPRFLFVLAVGLGGLAVAISNADASTSSWLRSIRIPGDLRKAIDLSEVFAHGFGVAAILLTLWVVTPARRSQLWLAIVLTLVSGVTANLLKSSFVRIRPNAAGSIIVPRQSESPAATASDAEVVEPSFWDSRQRSFPSGHTATAWGLAIGLSFVFPRGVYLFAAFATLASFQRITSGAHYPTDVLAGAAVAFLLSALMLQLPALRELTSPGCSVARTAPTPSKEQI